jgi:four helix bundle protein
MVYKVTAQFPAHELYGLVNQMRRATISVSSNIAEGAGHTSEKERKRYYRMAYASLMELLSQIVVSNDLGFVSDQQLGDLRMAMEPVSLKLYILKGRN